MREALMATSDLNVKLENVRRDLDSVMSGMNFASIKSSAPTVNAWFDAKNFALRWLDKARLSSISDESLLPLEVFARRLVDIGEGNERRAGETIESAIRRVRGDFLAVLPVVAYEFLEASGLFQFSESALRSWREDTAEDIQAIAKAATQRIEAAIEEADTTLKATAVAAAEDFERAKAKASEISVASAVEQFTAAHISFKKKMIVWAILTSLLLVALIVWLVWLLHHPPAVIVDVMNAMGPGAKSVYQPVPVSLLIATSAYFTSIRLAVAGIIGIAFAFSLRMTRAYLHLIEHNEHKLRVTKSIQAFVAAVRTPEQKDLVLGKLIESVTEFGDPGILTNQSEPASLPQAINIGSGGHTS